MEKKAKLKNQNLHNPIVEYYASIHINTVDDKRNIISQAFGQKFNSVDMLSNRRQAIEYLNSRTTYFFQEEALLHFSSPLEAELKNYRDYKSLSISLEITDNKGNQFETDGSEDTLFEFLSDEYETLKSYHNVEFIRIQDNWGKNVKVLKDDYDFFENLRG